METRTRDNLPLANGNLSLRPNSDDSLLFSTTALTHSDNSGDDRKPPFKDPRDESLPSKDLTVQSEMGLWRSRQKHPSNACETVKKIEIAPGQFMQLRGAQETYEAIKSDQFIPSTCFTCNKTVCCVDTATYVLCPDCRVVSPVKDTSYRERNPSVGLGFSLSDLSSMISDLGLVTPETYFVDE